MSTSARVIERFWSRVDRSGGADACWPWLGYRLPKGYGTAYAGIERRTVLAHRLAYELVHGAPAAELLVCHRCDNPPCCNPAHLFSGTASDNMRDASAKGRTRRTFQRRYDAARVSEVLRLRGSGLSLSQIARTVGGSMSAVHRIVQGARA